MFFKDLLNKIENYYNKPEMLITTFLRKYGFFIPDKLFLSIYYKLKFGKRLNLKNPKSFNEKLQWLKLYDRCPEYVDLADKYKVKNHIEKIIGKEYLAELLGVWDCFDEINFDNLPNKFVLKVNHTSGGVVVCKDKDKLDLSLLKIKFNKMLKTNYFYAFREYPYKEIKPKIFAEQLLENEEENLIVYKVFVFNGKPKIIQVIQNDKQINESIDYYDPEWNLLDLRQNYPNSDNHLSKPNLLGNMLDKSMILSQNLPFIRVDWYIVNNKLYFSEFTFYSDSGFAKFYPDKWDEILGSYLELPMNKVV
ncbi:MAG: glycosyl transferase [Candidatus Riflebacteria bacterium]|nr:glycosyl transferase [Candidatus Riflebacteria bacterium]